MIDAFEAERPRLLGIAYRMLGSVAEAEDVVQDTYLRWRDADAASPRAFLAAVVTRLSIDRLRSARARRERYVGPWLPEPIATAPTDRADVSMAFLVLLERLSPLERAAFVLHEVFDYSHAEVADALERDEAACRQLVHRARKRLGERATRRYTPARTTHERLLAAFLHACTTGDLAALRELLVADAVAVADGGGKARAARKALRGPDRIARFFVGITRKLPAALRAQLVELNGAPALLVWVGDELYSAMLLDVDEDERIRSVFMVRNPDKLARLAGRQS